MRVLALAGHRRADAHPAAGGADHGHARHRHRLVSADDQGLPEGRQQLHRRQRQPRQRRGRARGGGAPHRLRRDGRRLGLGRRGGHDLDRSRAFSQKVLISVGLVVLLMLGNLRGIRESGTIFMIPTYAYIVVMLAIIGYGVVRGRVGDRPASSRHRPPGRASSRVARRSACSSSCARSARAPSR